MIGQAPRLAATGGTALAETYRSMRALEIDVRVGCAKDVPSDHPKHQATTLSPFAMPEASFSQKWSMPTTWDYVSVDTSGIDGGLSTLCVRVCAVSTTT